MKLVDNNYQIPERRTPNKKKILITIGIIVFFILLLVLFSVYLANRNFRIWMDQYIFRKNISSENLPSTPISNDNFDHIFAYDNYIAILNQTNLTAYQSSGKKAFEMDLSINNPIYDIKDRFLCIAEQNGQKLYLISGQNIVWQNDIEGQITKVSVNKNGYVSVIVTGTSYKTMVLTFSPDGKELFRTILSKTIAIDISMSENNKYLALAEIDTSKSQIQSNIKVISFEKASSDPSNAVVYMYPASTGEIISNIEYHERERLVCLYDTSIHIIHDNADSKLMDIDSKKDLFCNINPQNHVTKVTEKSSGLFSDIEVYITNIHSKKENLYLLESIPKTVVVSKDVIALNLGTEAHFIDNNGWLKKKYSSSQEIKDIVVGSSIAGIIYKDKIEFIHL